MAWRPGCDPGSRLWNDSVADVDEVSCGVCASLCSGTGQYRYDFGKGNSAGCRWAGHNLSESGVESAWIESTNVLGCDDSSDTGMSGIREVVSRGAVDEALIVD